ncbi:aspartate aminotransferase family protein [Kineosporia babensis]|uniref:Aspartate aminotransferase family protein n=2 Tax=Kineosporia babensis TaxID=499548 RepID=A0A9X1NH10_9ACTN|nr:aspartate aminotransferase family protein [Kineosporia babensis]MCD5314957.1 aspartate aminotransferase family protein [Kineosporia babensis]
MDSNSFRPADRDQLAQQTRELTDRRAQLLAGSYRLFYREPVHLVRGQGQYLYDADGRQYLDLYNNVASLGHCHPAVVQAVTEQMQQLNTHTRYLHERILDYTDDLLSTFPAEKDWRAVYMCTGSEANDLALRVAQAHTSGEGVIATAEAYHGTSALTSAVSPALGSGQPIAPTVRLVPAPDTYRTGIADIGTWFANQVQSAIDDLRAHNVRLSALILDPLFSSDGVLPGTPGFLAPVVDVVRRNGGLIIADEVQPGFGRTGERFWGFARHGFVPDLVTLGKPMGNGMPVSGLVGQADVMASFSDRLPYFNTFGGNPVSMAAAQAVLDTIRADNLQEHSLHVGELTRQALRDVAARHEVLGDVRGVGLYTGVELIEDADGRVPDAGLALDVVENLRRQGVLTSTAGPDGNVLKLRPPLAFSSGNVDWLAGALDASVHEAVTNRRARAGS